MISLWENSDCLLQRGVPPIVNGHGMLLGLSSGRAKVVLHTLGIVIKDVSLPIIQVDTIRADG